MSRLPGRRHAVDVPGVLDLDLVDGQQEVAGGIDRVALDLGADQHPVGVADAGTERPVARQRVGAIAGGHRSAARVHAPGGEHERLRTEDLVLELLREHREQPVVLHVEGGDPAHRRIGLGDRQPDVDVGRHVDLVAAVPLGDERPEHPRRLERLDDLVERPALRLGLEGLRCDHRGQRADALDEAVGRRRAAHVAFSLGGRNLSIWPVSKYS